MKVILSGGGTGGHIYPALAVAEALRQENDAPELLYIGARGRMDEAIVGAAGLPFAAVRAGPLRVGSPVAAVRGCANLAAGAFEAWRLLGRSAADVVFATGGYASAPVGVAARLRRLPLVLYLPDVRPGWAVRMLARLATRIATTTERSLAELPAEKAVVVGYPVRDAFWSAGRDDVRSQLGLRADEAVVLIGGASQGARSLNDAVAQQLDALLDVAHVIHLTGRPNEDSAQAHRDRLPDATRGRYHVFGYLDDMAGVMAAADLAVLRSGASVLGELPAAGLPAILVPGVFESGYDQRANALFMEDRGAAVVLESEQLDRLAETVRELLVDEPRRQAMADAARRMARPDAALRIAQMVRDAAKLKAAA